MRSFQLKGIGFSKKKKKKIIIIKVVINILFYNFNNIYNVILFKILNDVTQYIILNIYKKKINRKIIV
jgi:hypothetical protein